MAFKGDGPEVTNLNANNLTSGTVATARLGSGTADSSTFLRGDNTWTAAGGGYIMRTYTSPATWTKPTGLKAVKVTVVGGGGGGGGGRNRIDFSPNLPGNGGGGGGGGGAIKYISAPSIPGPVTVTAGAGGTAGPTSGNGGAGGTSSFGAFVSATGGSGGNINAPNTPAGPGGTGGSGSSGDWNTPGTFGTTFANRNSGGSSLVGLNPAVSTDIIEAGNGLTPVGRGVGGGGGVSGGAPSQPTQVGGAGVGGIVIVEEFY